VLIGYLFVTAKYYKSPSDILPEEKEFVFDIKTGEKKLFPIVYCKNENDTVKLTIVVPAYNEEKRLHLMVPDTLKFLQDKKKRDPLFTYEIIIVNDGSKDKTYETALKFIEYDEPGVVRVMNLIKNRGKGGAIRRGVMVSRGDYVLFADADGATQISDINSLLEEIEKITVQGLGVAVGSRATLQKKAEVERTFFRNFLMWGFHFVVSVVGGVYSIKDTQCGFKLFTRRAAYMLFSVLHLERWAFDVELLALAIYFSVPMVEVSVNWKEIEGSHLEEEDIRVVSIKMFWDIFRCRLSYIIGVWQRERHDLKHNNNFY